MTEVQALLSADSAALIQSHVECDGTQDDPPARRGRAHRRPASRRRPGRPRPRQTLRRQPDRHRPDQRRPEPPPARPPPGPDPTPAPTDHRPDQHRPDRPRTRPIPTRHRATPSRHRPTPQLDRPGAIRRHRPRNRAAPVALARGHGQRPAVQVTIAASTLMGLDDQSCELDGYGPITAAMARRIAADPTATWRRLLTDDHGHVLHASTTGYRPDCGDDRDRPGPRPALHLPRLPTSRPATTTSTTSKPGAPAMTPPPRI